MKIALVSFGHTDVVLPLFKNLIKQGIEIDLIFCFALNRKSESVLDFTDKEIQTGFLSKSKISELLSAEIKNYLGDIYAVKFFIYYNLKLRSLKNFVLSHRLANELSHYDVIHFNGTNGVLPLLIYLLRKKKLVFTIHDIIAHSGERTRFNFMKKMNDYIIKSKYPLIVQNLSDYEDLRKQNPIIINKFSFIPFGVLDIYREFKDLEKEQISSDLLFFGRISPYKGIEYLIDAIKDLYSKGFNIKTIIAGSGQIYFDDKNFNKLDIMFINKHISNSELVKLIEGTKLIVCPYTDATQSGVVMTAFAFQKPVIATSVGGFKDVIIDGYNGVIVPPKDSKALADAISKLLKDNGLMENISKNTSEFEKEDSDFAWKNISNKLIEVYLNQ